MSPRRPAKGTTPNPAGPVPATDRCQHVKEGGELCGNRKRHGSGFCWFHDPETRDDVLAAARKGGDATRQRRAPVVLPKAGTVTLESADEVRVLLADTITRVRRGQLEVSVANSIGYLVQGGLKVIEATELERRLASVEAKLKGGPS